MPRPPSASVAEGLLCFAAGFGIGVLVGPDGRGRRPAVLPRGAEEVAAAAAAVGLPIPPACLPGVLANLALLDRHAAALRGPPPR